MMSTFVDEEKVDRGGNRRIKIFSLKNDCTNANVRVPNRITKQRATSEEIKLRQFEIEHSLLKVQV